MKYFFSKESIENLCNNNDGLNVYLTKGSCPYVKNRILSDIAEKAADDGLCTEKFLSPVDYDDLVCIYIKSKNCLVCDSQYYAAENAVKSFDTDSIVELEPVKEKLYELNLRKTAFLSSAAKNKNTAALLQKENNRLVRSYISKPKILNYIFRFVSRNGFCRTEAPSSSVSRRLSCITAWGVHSFYESILEEYNRIFTLCGKYKGINSILLSGLSQAFLSYGYDTICFNCSLTDEMEHLCVPSLSLAFLSDNDYHTLPYGRWGEIRTQRFLSSAPPQSTGFQLVLNNEQADEYISKTVFSMYDVMEVKNSVSDLLTDEFVEPKLKKLSRLITDEIFVNN